MLANRHVLQIVPAQQIKTSCEISVNHSIAITADNRGIAEALAKLMQAAGYHRTKVVAEVSAANDVVIALDALSKFSNLDEAIACNFRVFQHARIIANRFTQRGGIFIAAQATSGNFSFHTSDSHATWASGISGLVKTAAQEWPKAICQVLDVDHIKSTAKEIAELLFTQIKTGFTDLECGLQTNNKAITTSLNSLPFIAEKNLRLEKNAIIIASGGARGITAACLLALAKQQPIHIILLGRTALKEETPLTSHLTTEQEIKNALIADYQTKQQAFTLPEISKQASLILAQREIFTNLAAFKAAGSNVDYFAVDILDSSALSLTLQQIRKQFGKISAILHGAGVLADKLIAQKSDQQFNQVFQTKVLGLKNLLEATQQDKIKFLLLFSSVAARFGNVGQCDYAMANEVLNKIAQQEQQLRGKNCLVKSFNWGPWESGMVTPQLKILFQQRGIHLLSMTEGTELFTNELTDTERNHVEVIFGGRLNQRV